MSNGQRYLTNEMANELRSRRAALMAHRKVLEGAAAEILTIDEKVEAIDAELKAIEARCAALPAVAPEVASAQPA